MKKCMRKQYYGKGVLLLKFTMYFTPALPAFNHDHVEGKKEYPKY